MKYYLDTEFHQFRKKSLFGSASNTIELISIGLVTEQYPPDGDNCEILTGRSRGYYAICNEFDLKSAWNSHDIKRRCHTKLRVKSDHSITLSFVFRNDDVERSIKAYKEKWGDLEVVYNKGDEYKDYWLRDNVLKTIWTESRRWGTYSNSLPDFFKDFSYKSMKALIKEHGKSKKEIAEGILELVGEDKEPEFWAYFADYDWVVFCWLFGKMVDLPNHFPMYCRDLKQKLDDVAARTWAPLKYSKEERIQQIKDLPNYPINYGNHSAFDDARWNRKLHEFLTQV